MERVTKVPGLAARVACISSECRRGRGDVGAVDEALARVRESMMDTVGRWPLERGATFFVAFTVDREGRRELSGGA